MLNLFVALLIGNYDLEEHQIEEEEKQVLLATGKHLLKLSRRLLYSLLYLLFLI